MLVEQITFVVALIFIIVFNVFRHIARKRMFKACKYWYNNEIIKWYNDKAQNFGLCYSYSQVNGHQPKTWEKFFVKPKWYLYPTYREKSGYKAYWWRVPYQSNTARKRYVEMMIRKSKGQ